MMAKRRFEWKANFRSDFAPIIILFALISGPSWSHI